MTWLAAGVALSGHLMAAPGDYDGGFGDGGGFTSSFTDGDDYGYGVALQAGGEILVAGGSAGGDFSVLRLLSNGSPDPGFGTTGKAVHKFGAFELACGVAAVSGGKILVGGSGLVGGASRDFAVMRLLADGGLDPDYGTGGIVTTDIQGGFNETATCMAVDSGGVVTLAGSHRSNLALIRYTASGGPDPSFGVGGKVFTTTTASIGQVAHAIALQGDGKTVVAGQTTGSAIDMVLARYLANGTPDPDFGIGGQTITALGPGTTVDVANSVVVLPGGKILVAGTSGGDYALLRYTSAGVLDPEFGTGGSVAIGFGAAADTACGLAVQGDGKILLAGTSTANGRDYFGLLRFTSGGNLDLTFSGGGFLTQLTDGSDTARAITLQTDGRILVAGDAGPPGAKDFAIVRYESGGPVPLAKWRQNYFGSAANTGDGADNSDFDKDGLVNLLEYAFDQDPRQGSSCAVPSGQVSGGDFVTDFTAPVSVTGISYSAQSSATMEAGAWSPLTDTGSGGQHVFRVPMAGKDKLFLRWSISPQ